MTGYCKCDRCGKIYHSTESTDKYTRNCVSETANSINIKVFYTASLYFDNGCFNTQYDKVDNFDLCPQCYTDFVKWVCKENEI